MANRFPLIFNSGAGQIQELAASDNLDLTSSNLVNAGILFTSSGSATAPSISIGSGTTYPPGLYSPATDTLALVTAGTNRLHITSAGLVGIGNTAPGQLLEIHGASNPAALVKNTTSNVQAYFYASSTAGIFGTPLPHPLVFNVENLEKARIDTSGRFLVGTSSYSGNANDMLHVVGTRAAHFKSTGGASEESVTIWNTAASGTIYQLMFRDGAGATTRGSVTTNGSQTAYNTSSDYRLKENISLLPNAIVRLLELKPSRFNFISHPDRTVDGFIAHEVQAIVPEAINGEKDAVDDDGNPVFQGIDQSKLVPLLTAALQEAIGEIESLKARVAVLESA